jgi:hypothetical protein
MKYIFHINNRVKYILSRKYFRMSGASRLSGFLAHSLSGLFWSPIEVADDTDGDVTGDPEKAILKGER